MRGELSRTDGTGTPRLIRVAAVGDIHIGRDAPGFAAHHLERLDECANILLIAGDLTQHGHADEAKALASELRESRVPVVAVLGNHDYHQGEQQQIREELERVGVVVLEGEGTVIRVDGVRVGIAGTKGFGGGFSGACGSEFGEEEMKSFMRHARIKADQLALALAGLDCDMRIALTHYAPVKGTLAGERLEIYPFLGSYLLGESVDRAACAVAFHGHAHAGSERAVTAAGVPVRNVARPVIKLAYKVYTLNAGATLEESSVAAASFE
jgi:Icc-related predicted phosphoesterase